MDSIWEQLRTEERRLKATQLGVKVSDLEEQELLQETLEASRASNPTSSISTDKRTPLLASVSPVEVSPENTKMSGSSASLAQRTEVEVDDDSMYFDNSSVLFKVGSKYKPHITERRDLQAPAEVEGEGGRWHTLPKEVVDRILIILGDADMLGYIAMASKSTFRPSEAVFQYLCSITYPMQTAKKSLQVENWLSWRNMLIHRPRLRTNGFYTLRTKYSKGYCNDNFWEEKQYKSIEVKFYRHLRFFDHGRVLYSLDIVEPLEMVKLLAPAAPVPKRIFEGQYTIARREVTVEVPLHYCNMRFVMVIMDGDDGYEGKFNMLRLISHSSVPLRRQPHNNNNQHHNSNHNNNLHNLNNVHQNQQNHPHNTAHNANIMNNNNNLNNQQGAAVPVPAQQQQQQQEHRIEYTLPVDADLRFHRFWNFSPRQYSTR